MKKILVLTCSLAAAGVLHAGDTPADCPMHAQHAAEAGAPAPAAPANSGAAAARASSPYADHQHRGLKALSDEQIAGYAEGRGMGLALPAELHHYPGPRHALDAAKELALTPSQTAALEASFSRMKAEAMRLGALYVSAERDLDAFFATSGTDPRRLAELTRQSGILLAELRAAHLVAHIETRAALTPAQIAAYDRVRGYGGATAGSTAP